MNRARKKVGAGIVKKANELLKRTRVISKGLKAIGANRLAEMASQRGYGRKKKRGGCCNK